MILDAAQSLAIATNASLTSGVHSSRMQNLPVDQPKSDECQDWKKKTQRQKARRPPFFPRGRNNHPNQRYRRRNANRNQDNYLGGDGHFRLYGPKDRTRQNEQGDNDCQIRHIFTRREQHGFP
jgi:hypothetical protein